MFKKSLKFSSYYHVPIWSYQYNVTRDFYWMLADLFEPLSIFILSAYEIIFTCLIWQAESNSADDDLEDIDTDLYATAKTRAVINQQALMLVPALMFYV